MNMKKIFLISCGLVCVALAGLGVALPGLPTTPFLLLAAACFAKSSPYLHGKLLNNRIFGPLIFHWQKNRSIPRKAKIIAISSIIVMVGFSIITMPSFYAKLIVAALVIGPLIFLARLPHSEDIKNTPHDENNNEKR